MVVAVQVWAPLSGGSRFDPVFDRDLTRAQKEWQGEELIWLTPEEENIRRETISRGELRYESLHVPAERFNVIEVCHLDEKRNIYPRGFLPEIWSEGIPEGLYRQWLNTDPRFVFPAEKELSFRGG